MSDLGPVLTVEPGIVASSLAWVLVVAGLWWLLTCVRVRGLRFRFWPLISLHRPAWGLGGWCAVLEAFSWRNEKGERRHVAGTGRTRLGALCGLASSAWAHVRGGLGGAA